MTTKAILKAEAHCAKTIQRNKRIEKAKGNLGVAYWYLRDVLRDLYFATYDGLCKVQERNKQRAINKRMSAYEDALYEAEVRTITLKHEEDTLADRLLSVRHEVVNASNDLSALAAKHRKLLEQDTLE